jgi:prepilin-type N-terminal cleavage/methylation domain-containing protein
MKDNGFTLVEIVIAILVFGIATAAISSMFISIRNVQLQTSYYDTANRAAGREIESLRNNGYGSLTDGQVIDFTTSLPALLPHGHATATVSQPTAGLRRIDSTVTYTTEGVTRSVTLSSLIGEIGITQ